MRECCYECKVWHEVQANIIEEFNKLEQKDKLEDYNKRFEELRAFELKGRVKQVTASYKAMLFAGKRYLRKVIYKLLGLSYSICYKKGINNKVVGALSRRDELEPTSFVCGGVGLVEVSVASYQNDQVSLQLLAKKLVNLEITLFLKVLFGSKVMHTSPVGGNSRMQDTYQHLKLMFYWHGMHNIVESFVRHCANCQRNKAKHAFFNLFQCLMSLEKTLVFTSLRLYLNQLPMIQFLVVVDRFTKSRQKFSMSFLEGALSDTWHKN
ncbi:LOW QUALITY PROTEIN: hypothetical protein V2J09_022443 [Rumex salicifolius]